ncbi:MAG TPA: prolipoprotein diacylglyceryl transferase, partial [Anaerolineaceae bacterium]|nr:prolipoprotein diacylglyceryl transferase [Anaerolineaceae bacterium]
VLRNGLLLTIGGIAFGLFALAWLEAWVVTLITGQGQVVFIRVYYGLAFGLLLGGVYIHRKGLPLLRLGDRVLPAFALGFAIARLGCLAAGCCGGAETSAFWAMYTPDVDGHWLMRHPTQVISCLWQLTLFGGLMAFDAWRTKRPAQAPAWLLRDGLITYAYFFGFGVERFLLEFLRYDLKPIVGPFSLPHFLMLPLIVWSAWGFWQVASSPKTAAASADGQAAG